MRWNGWFCIILILRSSISDDSDIQPTLDFSADSEPVSLPNQVCQTVEPENARDHQFTAFSSGLNCVAAHNVRT